MIHPGPMPDLHKTHRESAKRGRCPLHVRWMGSLIFLFTLSGLSRGSDLTLPGVSVPKAFPHTESLQYDIGFLWFKQAAQGDLSLQPKGPPGHFVATLEAKTHGFIGLLTRYRKNTYQSFLRFDPLVQRLTTSRFVKEEIVGGESTKTVTDLDYKKREITWQRYEDGVLTEEGREAIPPGVVYEDVLSAFYNLRQGFYGVLDQGRHLTLNTLPLRGGQKKKYAIRTFDIRIATPGEEEEERKRFPDLARQGLLAIVRIPKEIFRQKTGEVRIWLDQDLIPLTSVIEDAIFFGDVKGQLTAPPPN